jgi:hydroxybutyrate-dimer hydrolase
MKKWLIFVVALMVGLWSGAVCANPALPSFIVKDSVQITEYDGQTNDLLSAGLNQEGLESSTPPSLSAPPTVAELRRLAIYNNYRGVIDPVPAGGMGLLWGPKSSGAPAFDPPVAPGLIPGTEYLAYTKVPTAGGNFNRVTLMVQIPANFDLEKRCIITAPPSGSRGVYGGIAVGEWGLFQGCAVAYGGKGTGTGFHLLDENTVYDINGIAGPADEVGREAQFRVNKNAQLAKFVESHPNRVATKHAHSQLNPERYWGDLVLRSIRFALWALNHHFKGQKLARFQAHNTIVIASGVSNGAGASVRALEQDKHGLIDGLVVTEPSLNPRQGQFLIEYDENLFDPAGQTLYDSITLMATYAGCASLNASLIGTPWQFLDPIGAPLGARANRCASLREKDLLTADNLAEQAAEALDIILSNGYYEDQNWGIASHEWLNLWRSLQVTYASAYGRLAAWENVCDVSFAATDMLGNPKAVPEDTIQALFANSSGIPSTVGIELIADAAVNGPIVEAKAVSESTGREDLNLDSALCFRYLATGDGLLLYGPPQKKDIHNRNRVKAGSAQMQTTGNLNGRPAIIFHGREDALVFPNIHSRAYYALNQLTEGFRSKLSYIEVTPAQHFDTFISSLWPPGSASGLVEFVPLHYYLTEGLDLMLNHLHHGDTLWPSQVVRATPRLDQPYPIVELPTLPVNNPGSDAIVFLNGILRIPK